MLPALLPGNKTDCDADESAVDEDMADKEVSLEAVVTAEAKTEAEAEAEAEVGTSDSEGAAEEATCSAAGIAAKPKPMPEYAAIARDKSRVANDSCWRARATNTLTDSRSIDAAPVSFSAVADVSATMPAITRAKRRTNGAVSLIGARSSTVSMSSATASEAAAGADVSDRCC